MFNLKYLLDFQVEVLSHSWMSKSGVWEWGQGKRYKFVDVGIKTEITKKINLGKGETPKT